MKAPGLRCLGFVLLLAGSGGLRAQALEAPALEAIGQGARLSGEMPADGSVLVPVPLLAGDEVEVRLTAVGEAELAVFDPAGAAISRTTGAGAADTRIRVATDAVCIVTAVASPGSRYELDIKRVVTARPPPPPVDPVWGAYARLAGQERHNEMFDVRWYWESPGQVLVEEWRRRGKLVWTGRISRGEVPGSLRFVGGKREWPGTVGTDGSVSWGRGKGGLIVSPFRMILLDDERLQRDYFNVSGEVSYSEWYQP